MRRNKIRYDEASALLKAKRNFIYPNFGFIDQLKDWEKIVMKRLSSMTIMERLSRVP